MNITLENDLKRCADMIVSLPWRVQNNKNDRETNFIYDTYSLDRCIQLAEEKKLDVGYVLHRWYNYHTSVYCEDIFCDYGAVHEENRRNHDVDIYIDGTPFDVKLTAYPKALIPRRPYDLTTRSGKNDMIKWFYDNQSKGSRHQWLSRLYVVCDTNNKSELLKMKCDFDLLREAIGNFMRSNDARDFNQVVLNDASDNNREYTPYSDIIYVRK